MSHRSPSRIARSISGRLFLACFLTLSTPLVAQTLYWDTNGATNGAGGATPGGNWEDASWGESSLGTGATGNWIGGRPAVFSAGNDATGSFTVNVGTFKTLQLLSVETGHLTLTGATLQFIGPVGYPSAASFTVGESASVIVNNPLAGTGLTLTGGGQLTLGSDFSGGPVTLQSGTLQLGNGGTTGSVSGNIANGGAVIFNRSNAHAYGGAITGAGSLTKQGAGMLTLTGANTYSGGTTISQGTLRIGDGGTTGAIAGKVVNNGNLQFFRSDNIAFGGAISGTGSLTQLGAGILTLNAVNTFTGSVLVSGGTLKSGVAGSLVNNVTYELSGNGTLDLNGHNLTMGGLTGFNGSIQLGAAALQVDQSSNSSSAVSINGSGSFTKLGAGTLTMDGALNHTGGTTISNGSLVIRAGSIAGDVLDNANITFSGSTPYTYSGVISGTGSLTKSGLGAPATSQLILTGNNTYSGGTTVDYALLQIGNGGASGSILGDVTVNINGSLKFNRSDDVAFSGVIGGTGLVSQAGPGVLTLTGNNTNTGVWTIFGGTLEIGNGGTAGSISTANITNNSVLKFNRGDAVTYAGASSGSGMLVKAGAGTMILTGTHSHTGGTHIQQGTLQIGSGGSTGSIATDIVNDSALHFNRSATTIYNGVISGTGATTFSGFTFLTNSNTYTGGTTVNGTLVVGQNGTAGAIVGNVVLNGAGSQIRFNRSDNTTFSGVISGSGAVQNTSAGTLKLTGANTYTGDTTITVGFIEFSEIGNFGTGAGKIVLDGGGLKWAAGNTTDISAKMKPVLTGGGKFDTNGNDVTFSSGITNSSGRALEKLGAGTLTLAASISNSGGTMTVSTGTLQVGNGGTVGTLSGNLVNHSEVIFNRSTATTFSGAISGNGSIKKIAANMLELAGDSSAFSGITTIEAGTLQIGNSNGSSGALGGEIVNNAALRFHRSTSGGVLTHNGKISGTGTLQKTGSGVLVLTADHTYIGDTTVDAGTLQFGDGGLSGSISGALKNNADVVFNRAGELDFDTVISGSGSVTKTGPGTLIYSANNTYSGTTMVAQGELKVNGMLESSEVTVAAGARLSGTGTIGADTMVEGVISAGDGLGSLTFTSKLTLASTAVAELSLGGNMAGSFDRLLVGGALHYQGTLFISLANGYLPAFGQTFDLFDSSTFTGSFDDIVFDNPSYSGSMDYETGVLTVVPEPSSLLLGILGAAFLLMRRRRGDYRGLARP